MSLERTMITPVLETDAPTVAGPPQGRWTYADWEALDHEFYRYEIINGVLYMSKSPSSFHQWVILKLVELVGIPAKNQGLAYPYFAPIGVMMPGCDPVQPDFVVVLASNASIIRDRRIFGVPDLIVEILSPSNRAYDGSTKLDAYAHAGLPEYAIVDPAARTLTLYRLDEHGRYSTSRVFGAEETVSFDCLPTLTFQVGQLFAGSPDTTL
jgi:Uma2 family endonuclease